MDNPETIRDALDVMREKFDPYTSDGNIWRISDKLTALSFVLEQMCIAQGIDLDVKADGARKKG